MATTTVPVVPVRVAAGGVRAELRAVKIVWQRELIRWWRDRSRLVGTLVQPFLFLFVLGTGLGSLVEPAAEGVDFKTFLFPGIVAMSVLFTAVFSGVSIVWDREFGFLREMLVAPVRRGSIVIGKCLGGATVALGQGLVILALAGLVDVPYSLTLILAMTGMLFVMALTITILGVMIASRITQVQSLMPIIQMTITPMMFLSGALFPLRDLPTWLNVLTRINPLTYAVNPMRHIVFSHLDLPPGARARLDPGITWGGWQVPFGLQILIVAVMGLVMLAVAIAQFSRTE
jgi:ABC-2 type transport system permease protein